MLRILFFYCLMIPFIALAQDITGGVSYYADKYQGKPTSSGELYDMAAYTAAHRTYPFGTKLKVTNLKNKKYVVVKVNDRGPYSTSRIIDVSRIAAEKLDILWAGTGQVSIEKISDSVARIIAPYVFAKETTPIVSDSLFRVYIAKIPKKGYGVQLGAFKEVKTMFDKIAILNEKGYKNVTVQINTTQIPPMYRVIIGPYSELTEAETNQKALTKDGFKGIVVTLEKL